MQKILINILILVGLSGCGIYQADIVQGNEVSAEQLQQVQVGMDKTMVKRLLGTPLVQGAFDSNRWEYYYSLRRDGEVIKHSLLTLNFQGERLASIEGKPALEK